MTPEKWRQVQDIFEEARVLEPTARREFLETSCRCDPELRAEVGALLPYIDADPKLLSRPVFNINTILPSEASLDDELAARLVGLRVGAYRLIEVIASGGMGAVYRAIRDDDAFDQEVAVKVVHPAFQSDEMFRRFRIERQLLAQLGHPNIARLLDGGVTDDKLWYFVMEFIDGVPIDAHSDRWRLTIRQRVELFLNVCEALQYAHQRLIVHCDLKPANILVTKDGQPKVLDFGIAKLLRSDATNDRTITANRALTPDYASPEQVAQGLITTGTDVYSLGVVLFELLTGRRPFDLKGMTPAQMERMVNEIDAPRASAIIKESPSIDDIAAVRSTSPNRLVRLVAGDLDNVIGMALRKEPSRRYHSIEQFADDLRRHLSGLPVLARKDTIGYRSRKFIRRNRIGVATAVAVSITLCTATVLTARQAYIARHERDVAQRARRAETLARSHAEENLRRAEQVTDFLINLFEVSDPQIALGESLTARDLLDRGAERVQRDLGAQPENRALLMDTIGRIYLILGLYEPANDLLTQALETRQRLFGDESAQAAQSITRLADLAFHQGEYDHAEEMYRRALAIRRNTEIPVKRDIAECLNNLGLVIHRQGDYGAAEPLLRQALHMRRGLLGETHSDTMESMLNLAALCHRRNKIDEAEALYRTALSATEARCRTIHPDLALILNSLAALLTNQDRLDEAGDLLRRSLEMRRKLYGSNHPQVASTLNNLAGLLKSKGEFDAAKDLYRQSLAIRRAMLRNSHPDIALTLNNLGTCLYEEKNYDAARAAYSESLDIWSDELGPAHPYVATNLSNLANVALSDGDATEAVRLYERALEIRRKTLIADHPSIASILTYLGSAYVSLEKFECALPAFVEAHDIYARTRGVEDSSTVRVAERVGDCALRVSDPTATLIP